MEHIEHGLAGSLYGIKGKAISDEREREKCLDWGEVGDGENLLGVAEVK